MKVENKSDGYQIVCCESQYYDSYGISYTDLTKEQVNILKKTYYVKCCIEKNRKVLSVFELNSLIYDGVIIFTETEICQYIYKNNKIQVEGAQIKLSVLQNELRNPEVFFAYVKGLLGQEKEYQDWFKSFQITSDDYFKIYYMILHGMDNVLKLFLRKESYEMAMHLLKKCINYSTIEENSIFDWTTIAIIAEKFNSMNEIEKYNELIFSKMHNFISCFSPSEKSSIINFAEIIKYINDISKEKLSIHLAMRIIKYLCYIKQKLNNTSFSEIVNYLLKVQYKTYAVALDLKGFHEAATLWDDYLNMKEDEEPDFPRNLKQSHDVAVKVYNEKMKQNMTLQNFKNERLFKEAVDSYEHLEHTGDNYCIVKPKEQKELNEFGEKLSNCVGSYMQRVIDKSSQILWLFSNNELKLALEVQENNLVQAKGFSNRVPNQEEQKYLQEWCEYNNLKIVTY